MNFRILVALVALAALASCKHAKRVTFLQVAQTEAPAIDLAHYQETYTGHPAVYLERRHTMDHVVEETMDVASWSFFEMRQGRYVVLDPADESYNVFGLSLPGGRTLKRAYLYLTDPDGTVHRYTMQDFKVTNDSSGRTTWKLAYPTWAGG